MATKIVLITHNGLGQCMLDIAKKILNDSLKSVITITVDDDNPENEISRILKLLSPNEVHGYLFLTDLIGATPYNITKQVAKKLKQPTAVLTGLNLAMLLKVVTYQNLSLNELTQKALLGGKEEVTHHSCEESQ